FHATPFACILGGNLVPVGFEVFDLRAAVGAAEPLAGSFGERGSERLSVVRQLVDAGLAVVEVFDGKEQVGSGKGYLVDVEPVLASADLERLGQAIWMHVKRVGILVEVVFGEVQPLPHAEGSAAPAGDEVVVFSKAGRDDVIYDGP